MASTLYDKIFAAHQVNEQDDGTSLIYIDRHLLHEVTTPQAFEGLKVAGRKVRRPDCSLATVDHNIPTTDRKGFRSVATFIKESDSRLQVSTLEQNVVEFGLTYYGMADKRQGIVHVIGPEQGFTLPGTTVVCGDSHTSTHGAFGALAFGIGTSEVEHVLATQTLLQKKSKNMRVRINGHLSEGVTSKDIALHVIGVIGTAGGNGCVIEFCGTAIEDLSMEARMSICNMSIEAGARAGLIAPDEITYEYVKGRPLAPSPDEWDRAVAYWKTLKSDKDAIFDISVDIEARDIEPTVSWGTSPQDVAGITGVVPDPAQEPDAIKRAGMERSLEYMGLTAGTKMQDVKIDKVFIGSCTNSRIEDLRSAAKIAQGRKVASHVYAMIVPGSGLIKQQAEAEGLDKIFTDAGFDWREAGCSMCLGMNPDQLAPQERCASTSNRNFEGRQGAGGRTHLCSPGMAAAAAISGYLSDVRQYNNDTGAPIRKTEAKTFIQTAAEIIQPAASSPRSSIDAASPEAATTAADDESGMTKFTTLKGTAAPFPMSNVDTDKIIPKQFLKTIKRTGLGTALFHPIRYLPDSEEEDPSFVLNKAPYRDTKILVVTGPNFGCGSSREHAPWALKDFGIRCILAPSYADIFFNNCFKNGMLPIVLGQAELDLLARDASDCLGLEIDLPKQVVRRSNGEEIPFEVEEFRKHCLVNGLDDIGLTLQQDDKIVAFEAKRTATWPWLDGKAYKTGGQVKLSGAGAKKLDW